ncbi:MAG: RNase P subunit p30 family protein [Candidatus Bathyarchaeota archaeon]|jgi:RNase P/RNase MRP subunit p30|nr:RNase P subunit p30 family protein [Candidatus Bathyarchaeota archaeon]
MRRIYADLHLCPNLKDLKKVANMISRASKLGYRLIAITFPLNVKEEIEKIQNISSEYKIDMASRIDLKPRTPKELIYNLRKLRRKFEIIAVICESKTVARQAAKDRRVDLLNFPSPNPQQRFFDAAEAELASKALASFEIDMKPLLTLEGPARVRLLSSLRRETAIAQRFHVPIVISSGASEAFYMRKPRDMAALASLFDLDEISAINAVSKNSLQIVKRNRENLSPNFVAPGIKVIRKGKDC